MHLHDFPFQTSPNTYIVEEGTLVNGTPYQRARGDITYEQGPFSVTWTLRYVGSSGGLQPQPGSDGLRRQPDLAALHPGAGL